MSLPRMAVRLPGVAAAVVGIALLVWLTRTAQPIVTDSDIAVAEIYTDLALAGDLRVGPYSRFGWNHPGPLYFYLQAPLYGLSGRNAAALFVTAAVLNLLALWILERTIARNGGGLTAALAVAGCLTLAWRVPRLLASPWTAHATVLSSITLLALCAAVAAGRFALLPLTALVASYIIQTHVGFAPLATGLLSLALVTGAIRARRTRKPLAWPLGLSGCVLLAVWSLPAVDALRHHDGNLQRLWSFFLTGTTARQGHSWNEAIVSAVHGLTGIVRTDLDLPWGGHFAPDAGGWPGAFAAVQIVLLVVVAWRSSRQGRPFEANLSLASLLALLIAIWSLTRIPDDILDHEVFWLSALGAFNLGLIAAVGVRELAGIVRVPPIGAPWLTLGLRVVVVTGGILLALRSVEDFTAFERRRTDRATIVRAYDALEHYMIQEGFRKPLVTLESSRWSQAAGILLRMNRAGFEPAVSDEWVPMFTRSFSRRGTEDVAFAIGEHALGPQQQGQPDAVLVFASSGMYVYASRLTRH
jgi:hypothetical protein